MTITTRPPRQRRPVPVRRRHLSAVLESCGIAVIAAYLAAAAATGVHAHWWIPAAVTLIAGALTAVTVAVATGNGGLALCVSGWALVLGGWLGWVMLAGAYWSQAALAALGAPAAVMTVASLLTWARHTDENLAAARAEAARTAAEEARRAGAKLERYARILAELGCEGCTAVAEAEARGGRSVTITLPASGKVTLDRLRQIVNGVSVALRLPYGAVSFADGQPGQAIMWLNETDILAEDVPFPEDSPPLTINAPLTLGIGTDGEPAGVLFRGVAVYTIGM